MAIARFEMPDGRIARFEVPEGTTPEEAQALMETAVAGGIQDGTVNGVTPPPSDDAGGGVVATKPAEPDTSFTSFIEPAVAIGSSIIAEPVAGIAGVFQILNPFADEGAGAEAVEATRKALTFQPRSAQAKKVLGEVGGVLEPVGEALSGVSKGLGETVLDVTGSPLLATIAHTTPTAIAEFLGLKGIKALKPATRLIDKAGRPTKALRKVLNKRGLDFDNLSPETRKLIPEVVEPGRLPGADPAAARAESAIKTEILSGSKDDALAGLRVDAGGVVVADRVANKTLKQGLEPGVVQMIKTATPATKTKMLNMTRRMRRIKKQARLGTEIRPSDVVGDAVTNRIDFIAGKKSAAAKELNQIASNKLRGKKVNAEPVVSVLEDTLNDLDVSLVEDSKGTVRADFTDSIIEKNGPAKKAIGDMVDLLMKPVEPDALRMHKLKRQLDDMVDFSKKGKEGLSRNAENAIKNVRRQVNDTIRIVDPDYARVNDVLSEAIETLNDLDDAVGGIDITGKGANKALGTRMRALLSNQQGRIKIENALDQINTTATNMGGKFQDNVKDLIVFSDALDAKFGTVAKTSFAGQIEQATTRALSQSPSTTLLEKGAAAAGRGVEKLRGINDFNAFESIEELLLRGGK